MTCSPVPELQGEPDDIVREKCLLAVEKVSQNEPIVSLRGYRNVIKEANLLL